MKFIHGIISCTFLLLAVSICGRAQTPETATVYIYKIPHALTLGRVAIPILLDGKDIAHLDKNRYLIAKIPVGRRVIQSKHKKTIPLTLDLKAGDTIYVRAETGQGHLMLKPPTFLVVTEQQAKSDMEDMKPIEAKDIKERSIVQLEKP